MNKKWKPQVGEQYYIITELGYIWPIVWDCSDGDKRGYTFGNVFKTQQQARQAAKLVKQTLLAFHIKLNRE
jgi:hypothetical protein